MDAPELASRHRARPRDAVAFEARWKGKLAAEAAAPETGHLGRALRDYEALEELMGRIVSYAGLIYAGDTSDPKRAKLYGDIQEKMTDASARLLFFSLELNLVDDALIAAALDGDPGFGHYRPWVLDLRKDKPYQLEDRVEQLFHEKSITGRGAWNRLFDETMTDLRFEVDGEELPLEPTLNLLQDPDGDVRKARGRSAGGDVQGEPPHLHADHQHAGQGQGDLRPLARLRGHRRFAPPRQPRRAQCRGRDGRGRPRRLSAPVAPLLCDEGALARHGRDEPLGPQRAAAGNPAGRRSAWEEARDTVLTAYHQFSPEMAEIARGFFDRRWIDAPVRPGKAPGAFAHPTVPSAHPYVLLNYMGKPRDVMTLAHELGHGVHQVLAGGQGALMASTPLTLAETASVFGEMLTFRSLLDQTTDRRERKAMLAQKVEDMINTVVRQIAFYQFERKVHGERRRGELTADRIGEFWLEVQAESLGPSIRLREGYETFWTYVPHFIHSPFYVYAYAFGDCLVNSLYAVYQNAERGFQEKYFDMLRAGGTKHHSELLAPFGLDASDPGLLADRTRRHRRHDRRTGGAGLRQAFARADPRRGCIVRANMVCPRRP